jgi:vancomycin resistance protein YoaR
LIAFLTTLGVIGVVVYKVTRPLIPTQVATPIPTPDPEPVQVPVVEVKTPTPTINRTGTPREILMAPEVQIKLKEEPGTVNARRAAEILNGYVLKSGEIFSYNTVVAPRTEANGFVYGGMPVKIDGVETIVSTLASGACRVVVGVATEVKRTGLEQLLITPHEYTPYYFAANPDQHLVDATVYTDGGVDYTFRNNKDFDIRIRCSVDKEPVLHVSFYKLIYPNN